MRGLPSILSLFCKEFDKFNNTRTRMLDSIYHNDIKITLKSHFCRKNVINLSLYTQSCYGRHNVKPLVVYQFYCMALLHSQTGRHMIRQCYYMALSVTPEISSIGTSRVLQKSHIKRKKLRKEDSLRKDNSHVKYMFFEVESDVIACFERWTVSIDANT